MIKNQIYTLGKHQIKPNVSAEVKSCSPERSKQKKKAKPSATNKLNIKIHSMDNKNLEIDFIGFHFSLVNAYRRIVLAEVATMAIEKVYMYKNTSIVQDEVLAHRIGLVPLNVPPHFFNFRRSGAADAENFTEENCVKFKLRVKCRGKKDTRQHAVQDEDDIDSVEIGRLVTAQDLRWVPIGNQEAMFAKTPLAPLREEVLLPDTVKNVNTDLVLAKLNPGQRLLLEAYAYKGIGSDHAKFQPGLCWYRMLPEVTLNRRVLNEEARLLQRCFSQGVVEVIKNEDGDEEACVLNSRYDTCSRNVYNYDCLKDAVTMTRNSEHIIFYVESHSALKSYEILEAAIDVMIEKCDALLQLL